MLIKKIKDGIICLQYDDVSGGGKMDNETKQMFELIIKKLDNVEKLQETMGNRMENMDSRMESMENRMENIEVQQKKMVSRLENVEKQQESMGRRQDEIFSVVKAIEHSNNIHKAEIDNLTYKIAHTEGTINNIGDIIIERKAIK